MSCKLVSSWRPGPPADVRHTVHQTKLRASSLPCPSMPGTSKMTICPGDAIPEDVALSFPPCTDENLASDASKSVISSTGNCSLRRQTLGHDSLMPWVSSITNRISTSDFSVKKMFKSKYTHCC